MAWPAVTSPESNFATPDQAHKALTLQLVHQIHYWIECCLLRGLDQAETTCVLQQQLGLQPCLTRIGKCVLSVSRTAIGSNTA
ncbi:TPA: hypothetical protein ACH3X2_011853 [Trebouxia sp. C0005]